jgi:hypothetical protein
MNNSVILINTITFIWYCNVAEWWRFILKPKHVAIKLYNNIKEHLVVTDCLIIPLPRDNFPLKTRQSTSQKSPSTFHDRTGKKVFFFHKRWHILSLFLIRRSVKNVLQRVFIKQQTFCLFTETSFTVLLGCWTCQRHILSLQAAYVYVMEQFISFITQWYIYVPLA